MADTSYIIDLILQAKDQTSKELKNIKDGLKTITATAGAVTAGMIAFGKSAIDSANEWNTSLTTMNTMLSNTGKSTDEAIESLNNYVKTQQKTSVLSNDVALAIAKQGAAFELSADNIEKLLPAVENYILGERGLGASAEDAKSLMNGLAQALNGNTASLTRAGRVLDDETKAMIMNGTETEKVAGLIEVLNSQYEGLNETLADTTEGRMILLKNNLSDIKQTIGQALLPVMERLLQAITPIVEKVANWIQQNPELTAKLIEMTVVIGGLIAGLGAVGLAIPGILSALSLLLSPIGLLIAGITALRVARETNFLGIQEKTQQAIDFIKPYVEGLRISLQEFRDNYGTYIMTAIYAARDLIKAIVADIVDVVSLAFEGLFTALGVLIDIFSGNWESAWTKIKNFGQTIAKTIDDIMTRTFGDMRTNIKNGVTEAYNRIVGKIQALVDKVREIIQDLKNAWNSAKEAVGGIFSRDRDTRASGGPVYQGQQYLVGENGPEMFVPSTNGRIIRNEDLGGSGEGIVVNINMGGVAVSNGQDEQSLAETIANTITRQLELYKKAIY